MLPLLSPASPFVKSQFFSTNVSSLSAKFATSLPPHSGRDMTHLSAGLRFFSGTHLSIETGVSVPPWPAHHWSMVSPRKETVDFTLREVRSPPAPVGQSESQLGRSREGRFLGGAPLLSSACCWRRLLTTLPTPPSSRLLLLLWYLGGKQQSRCCCCCVSSR